MARRPSRTSALTLSDGSARAGRLGNVASNGMAAAKVAASRARAPRTPRAGMTAAASRGPTTDAPCVPAPSSALAAGRSASSTNADRARVEAVGQRAQERAGQTGDAVLDHEEEADDGARPDLLLEVDDQRHRGQGVAHEGDQTGQPQPREGASA